MVCCRCNRAGVCRSCACVKAKRPCVNCLPSKQGNCTNISTAAIPNATSNVLPPSTSTLSRTSHIHCSTSTSAINTLPVLSTSQSTDSVCAVNTAPAATQAGPPTRLQFPLQLVHPASLKTPSSNNNHPLELHYLQ